MKTRLALLVALMLLLVPGSALAERVVTSSSSRAVSITQSFSGETITLFGNIEPDAAAAPAEVKGPYEVVIVITGPLSDRVARRKTRQLGLWMNADQVRFHNIPSYFRVLSSHTLSKIASPATLAVEDILPEAYVRRGAQSDWWNAVAFGDQLVRLMTEKGYYGTNEGAVTFHSNTLYSARFDLSSDVPNGPFAAHTYVFKNGVVVARAVDSFSVSKAGFERFLGSAASDDPLLYGLAAAALALLTGWLGGVLFRR